MAENEIHKLWKNPKNWRFFLFYYCKADPRIIVPRRLRIFGWTLNLARPLAIPTLILTIIGVLTPFKILRRHEAPIDSPWGYITVAFVLIGLGCFCSVMASSKRYTEKEKE
ncbi:MAG: DUF5808 domain-containing protein [Sedimentisphaerales bacterium]|nr:DUF5808 domain-containing protein [Sedimentisphaerales bacterium]